MHVSIAYLGNIRCHLGTVRRCVVNLPSLSGRVAGDRRSAGLCGNDWRQVWRVLSEDAVVGGPLVGRVPTGDRCVDGQQGIRRLNQIDRCRLSFNGRRFRQL